MKRVLPILLCLILLTGCSAAQAPTQPQTEPAATQPKELVSLYDGASQIEQQTGGAVRAYPLGDGEYRCLLTMGEAVVAVSTDGILTAVQGEKGEVVATGMAQLPHDWVPSHFTAGDWGILYFAQESRQIVTLDLQLQQTRQIPMPEDSQGDPLLHFKKDRAFYCTEDGIRVLDMQTGISRLVRQHSYGEQELLDSLFDEDMITCRVTDEKGQTEVLYLLSEGGREVYRDTAGFRLQTLGERYFAVCPGENAQYLFGSRNGETKTLEPQEETVTGLLTRNGAAGYTWDGDSTTLAFYDLATGQRCSQVILPQLQLTDVVANQEAVWFLAGSTLYRWEIARSYVENGETFADTHYTAENPDTAALADCQAQVERLRESYGLELYIWEEAAEQTKDYQTEPEYRADVTRESLDAIEAFLKQCPEGFLKTTGSTAFYLVKSLNSGAPAAQYWQGAISCTVLDTSRPLESFLWGLGFAMDAYILGNSRDFDAWDDLNPKGFEYTYDYAENAQRKNPDQYLKAFIDQQAMSFPTEDRSSIFAYGCMPGNEEYFANKTLQKKLTRVCEAIRDAYEWKKSTQIFPWEQYLDEPLAKEA